MASAKSAAGDPSSPAPEPYCTGSILSELKSSSINTTAKLCALKPRRKQNKKVNNPSPPRRSAVEGEHLNKTAERLCIQAFNVEQVSPTTLPSRPAMTAPTIPQSDTTASNGTDGYDTEREGTDPEDTETKATPPITTSPPAHHFHPSPALSLSSFELGSILGQGKFGRVFLARHIPSSFICALKIISKTSCLASSEEKFIRRELEVHRNLSHRHILRLYSWFHDASSIYFVLEYAAGGNLFSQLNAQPKGRFNEDTAARYIGQVASALRYMHGKRVMHRDIKPENILLGLFDEVKLADFGYSIHSNSGQRLTICGTLDYVSPEVAGMMMKGTTHEAAAAVATTKNPEDAEKTAGDEKEANKKKDAYTRAVDQWSLGILLYELLVGRPPFEMRSGKETQKRIAKFKGKGLKVPGHVSQPAEELIRALLHFDAEKRMSLERVLVHPWIGSHVGKEKRKVEIEIATSDEERFSA